MIYILGCDHYVQNYELTESDEEISKIERAIKNKFYEVTEDIIRSRNIQFVGEECRPDQKTIPRALAAELGCSYSEVDMPSVERQRLGIAKNYQSQDEEERNRVYDLREEFMVKQIYSTSDVEARKLIVCGAEHLNGLETLFLQHGEVVETRDLVKEDLSGPLYKRKMEKFIV